MKPLAASFSLLLLFLAHSCRGDVDLKNTPEDPAENMIKADKMADEMTDEVADEVEDTVLTQRTLPPSIRDTEASGSSVTPIRSHPFVSLNRQAVQQPRNSRTRSLPPLSYALRSHRQQNPLRRLYGSSTAFRRPQGYSFGINQPLTSFTPGQAVPFDGYISPRSHSPRGPHTAAASVVPPSSSPPSVPQSHASPPSPLHPFLSLSPPSSSFNLPSAPIPSPPPSPITPPATPSPLPVTPATPSPLPVTPATPSPLPVSPVPPQDDLINLVDIRSVDGFPLPPPSDLSMIFDLGNQGNLVNDPVVTFPANGHNSFGSSSNLFRSSSNPHDLFYPRSSFRDFSDPRFTDFSDLFPTQHDLTPAGSSPTSTSSFPSSPYYSSSYLPSSYSSSSSPFPTTNHFVNHNRNSFHSDNRIVFPPPHINQERPSFSHSLANFVNPDNSFVNPDIPVVNSDGTVINQGVPSLANDYTHLANQEPSFRTPAATTLITQNSPSIVNQSPVVNSATRSLFNRHPFVNRNPYLVNQYPFVNHNPNLVNQYPFLNRDPSLVNHNPTLVNRYSIVTRGPLLVNRSVTSLVTPPVGGASLVNGLDAPFVNPTVSHVDPADPIVNPARLYRKNHR